MYWAGKLSRNIRKGASKFQRRGGLNEQEAEGKREDERGRLLAPSSVAGVAAGRGAGAGIGLFTDEFPAPMRGIEGRCARASEGAKGRKDRE